MLPNVTEIKSRKFKFVEACSILRSEEKRVQGFSGKFKEIDILKPKTFIVR
jgi:hypothetical protein